MLHFLPSLILFAIFAKGKLEGKALSKKPSILDIKQENVCTEYVNVDFYNLNPLIYKKKGIKKGTVICINSSSIYMSIIFHSWKNFEAKTFYTHYRPNKTVTQGQKLKKNNLNFQLNLTDLNVSNNQTDANYQTKESDNGTEIIEDGPYTEKDSSIIGFSFGRHLGQIQLKALKSNAMLSFGLIIFNEMSTLRIISNSKEDTLKFNEPRNRYEYSCHRHIQYFNGLPGSQSYSIDMNIDEEEDYINFRNANKCSMNYTGELSLQKKMTEEEPQIFNFHTNSKFTKPDPSNNGTIKDKKLDVILNVEESSNFVKSKKYGRMWTSSGKYSTIHAFYYDEYSPHWIIIIVVSCVVFAVLVVALITFIVFKRRKSRFIRCNEAGEEGIDNNNENEGQTSKSTKKRRMLFESVVEVLHSTKSKKDEPANSSKKGKDNEMVISQSNLLGQDNEK